ncbi:MAG: hypothetical protein AVDCRST_MAG70-244 [uncultured Thermomicrobiales bacterium]|uniref:Uncharacterized protein n=1 Tax=uncultured Thermomicrobiales bacterium TaxID=1645740 RepID=A0A6J4UA30_9BACT|nr:MAG: hypothetical protein AVDCRST_MAG70-244 [uncultured Thermomicrobiales bacterium]
MRHCTTPRHLDKDPSRLVILRVGHQVSGASSPSRRRLGNRPGRRSRRDYCGGPGHGPARDGRVSCGATHLPPFDPSAGATPQTITGVTGP